MPFVRGLSDLFTAVTVHQDADCRFVSLCLNAYDQSDDTSTGKHRQLSSGVPLNRAPAWIEHTFVLIST